MSSRTPILIAAALALTAALPAVAQDRDDPRESYSYVRVLDGSATLASEAAGPGEPADVNQPLMTGDRVTVARGAHLEIALADRNLLRVGGDSALTLAKVAFSGDRGDRSTEIDLDAGEVVLVVTDAALGDSLPEIRTPEAEIVIHRPGTYRVETRTDGWTEVVVREGFAELVTSRGSTIVRENESAWAAESRRNVDLTDAGPLDSLERWSADLTRQGDRARTAELHVEPELAYSAAPLDDYGTWITVDSGWYWQPRVAASWRPYWQGRWIWTPSGLTWVSTEPWGWLPYHYGTWVTLPGHGWLWRPGRLYAPAWVYWRWTDDWVGWVPTGYYTSWYAGWGFDSFLWGVYGWAGGGWGSYYDWNFVPTHCLRRHDQHPWMRRGHDLERELGTEMPRGVLTTDTRDLPRKRFADPGVATGEFLERLRARRGSGEPDVSDFVARRRQLPPQVIDAVRPEPGARLRLGGSDAIARDINPRPVPPAATRGDGGRSSEALGGGPVTSEGRLFDGNRLRPGVNPPVPGDTETGRQRPNTGGSRGSDELVGRPPARATTPLQPGGTVEIGRDGSVRPVGRQQALPPATSEPRVPPAVDHAPRSGSEGAPADENRQGWRSREGWSGAPGTSSSGGAAATEPSGRGQPRSEAPVQRVLGGVRRSDGSAWQTPGEPSPAWRGGSGDVTPTPRLSPPNPLPGPRPTPRTSAPGTSAPSVSPRSLPPGGSQGSPGGSASRAGSGPSPRPAPPSSTGSGSRPPSRPSSPPPPHSEPDRH